MNYLIMQKKCKDEGNDQYIKITFFSAYKETIIILLNCEYARIIRQKKEKKKSFKKLC